MAGRAGELPRDRPDADEQVKGAFIWDVENELFPVGRIANPSYQLTRGEVVRGTVGRRQQAVRQRGLSFFQSRCGDDGAADRAENKQFEIILSWATFSL